MKKVTMKRFLTSCSLALCAAALLTGPLVAEELASVANEYLPADANAIVVAYPQKLLAEKHAEIIPHEIIQAAGEEFFGFDPTDIVQAVGVTSMRNLGQEEPLYGLVLRFDNPYTLSENITREEPALVGGAKVYRIDYAHSVCPVDAKTLLVGSTDYLADMIAAKDVDSAVLKIVASQPPASHLNVYFNIESIRDFWNEMAKEAPPLPEPFAPLIDTPNLARHLTIAANLNEDGLKAGIKIVAYDQTTSDKFNANLEVARTDGVDFILDAMKENGGSGDPIEAAMQQYNQRIIRKFAEKIKPTQRGLETYLILEDTVAMGMLGSVVSGTFMGMNSAMEVPKRRLTRSDMQLRQIGLALHNYHDVHLRMPPAAISDEDGKPLLSWRVAILPFIEEQALYEKFHLDEPWDSEHNIKLLDEMPDVYAGDAEKGAPKQNVTAFLGVSGERCLFNKNEKVRFRDITDGSSNTLAVIEVGFDKRVQWTKPVDYVFNAEKPFEGIGRRETRGFRAITADGAGHEVSYDIEAKNLANLMMRNDGKVVWIDDSEPRPIRPGGRFDERKSDSKKDVYGKEGFEKKDYERFEKKDVFEDDRFEKKSEDPFGGFEKK